MKRVLSGLGGLLALLVVAGGAFWFSYLRNLPEITIELRHLNMAGNEQAGAHDCLWMGPVSTDSFNVAFPDGGAVYWPTVFKAPAEGGGHLEITGFYPEARYFSFNTYRSGAVPYDHLTDLQIVPDDGSTNPFQTGSYRPGQRYTIRVRPGVAPENRPANTLFFGPSDEVDPVPLILRVYVPETANDPTGGAGLPQVTLVRASGERLEGVDMCAAVRSAEIGSDARALSAPIIPMAVYQAMFADREVREALLESPSGAWALFWGPRLSVLRTAAPALARLVAFGARIGLVARTSGYYANSDNDYVSTYINERFGEVVVLRGRLPRTPARGSDLASGQDFDLRYWSLCTNEGLATTRYADCVYDSQIAIDGARTYTIVISKAANRPDNATTDCGVTWLDWGDRGDGGGHEHLGVLIIRNMLPSPNFAQAIQRIPRPGDERATMGPYLPSIDYVTRAAFEQRGC